MHVDLYILRSVLIILVLDNLNSSLNVFELSTECMLNFCERSSHRNFRLLNKPCKFPFASCYKHTVRNKIDNILAETSSFYQVA